MYLFVLTVFLAGFALIWRIVHSPFGQVLKAIREHEDRTISLGYDTNRYKLLAFVLSGALAGTAGATKALVFQLASLTDVHWSMSGEVVLMTLVGGMGTMFGPVAGAAIIVSMQSYLAELGAWVTVVQGIIFVLCVSPFAAARSANSGTTSESPSERAGTSARVLPGRFSRPSIDKRLRSATLAPTKIMVSTRPSPQAPRLLQLAAPQTTPRIPPRFEYAAHAMIQRALEHHTIALAIAYGQFPWESENPDGTSDPPHGSDAAQLAAPPETPELQLALILDDEVSDFVAAKLELTRIAYDTFLETGVEIAPFPIAITHWYLPAKAPNPGLIEALRRNGLRLDIDRARATLVRKAPRREPKSSSQIMAALGTIAEGLFQRYALIALHYIPQRHHAIRSGDHAQRVAQNGSGALSGNLVADTEESASPRDRPEPLERGPVDVLADFGGRPSSERVLGVQDALESALGLPVQLLTASSMRRDVRGALLLQALEVGSAPANAPASATPRSEATTPRASPRARFAGDFSSRREGPPPKP